MKEMYFVIGTHYVRTEHGELEGAVDWAKELIKRRFSKTHKNWNKDAEDIPLNVLKSADDGGPLYVVKVIRVVEVARPQIVAYPPGEE